MARSGWIGHIAAMVEASGNAPDVTVSELSNALKRTLEDRFGFVRVRGEVSGYRGPHASGHVYFSLKDANARLDAVIWKQVFLRMKTKPTEGLEVIASGRITSFPGKSAYQIVIESIEPAGVGALMALLEERRKKLAAEGLFDAARKRPLPFLPQSIGVITSPTGAVIRDILHRLADRFPRPVLIWPVRVQGETSADEVAAAIRGFNALPNSGPLARPSVIIVARGGGSLEDLWGFNDENVVRAAADSMIPIISAIGHETDWTLLDLVADLRAPTPTGAAELAAPVRIDLLSHASDLSRRLELAAHRGLTMRRSDLRSIARALPQGRELVEPTRQRLDRSDDRLRAQSRSILRDLRLRIGRSSDLLLRHSPRAELRLRRERLVSLGARLSRMGSQFHERDLAARRAALDELRARLRRGSATAHDRLAARGEALGQILRSLSYKSVLDRGFALVRGEDGRMIRRAGEAPKSGRLTIVFADGDIGVASDGRPAARQGGGGTRRRPDGTDQGALF